MKKINANIFHQAEVEGNRLACLVCLVAMIAFMVMYVLIALGIVVVVADINTRTVITNAMVILMTVCYILGFVNDYDKPWLKYVLLFSLLNIFSINYALANYGMHIILTIPLILSCRYYSKKFMFIAFVLTILHTYYSIKIGAIIQVVRDSMQAMNLTYDLSTYASVGDLIRYLGIDLEQIQKAAVQAYFIPVLIQEGIIFLICNAITDTGTNMILEQDKISSINASVEKELSLAADIQTSMLPSVFPAFPDRDDFDIYASMTPAKEVGGDLYDFFMVDDSHIAILIGDVSGKGVPAAMFMVRARTLIKDYTLMNKNLGRVFTEVNKELSEGNKEGLFVTCWLGIIDLQNGKLIYVNAGHNRPIIKKKNSDYEYLNMKPGFILAGLDDFQYEEEVIDFSPGDKILLYTDGVTEARDDKAEFYTEKRLLDFVNGHKDLHASDLVQGINDDIFKFANGATQYDDITMLDFEYIKTYEDDEVVEAEVDINVNNIKEKTLSFPVSEEAYNSLVTFLKQELVENGCPEKELSQIIVAVEELYSNVVFHGYPKAGLGHFSIKMIPEDKKVTLIMKDDATPFNPLEVAPPDITLSADERKIGGLGIYIVRETMDEFRYERKNDKNVVTIVKSWN